MADLMVQTKFYIPRVRPDSVARPRLCAQLDQGLRGKLTLISAPAGAGKTTLLGEWHATERGQSMPVSWVSLEPADDHPERFWQYVATALDRIRPGVGAEALVYLRGQGPVPLEAVIGVLSNALAQLTSEAVLVLDDYHVITSDAIHRSLGTLLDHLPPQLHLVITTREDPPLPLHRLRVRGELTEIRLGDLRFTPAEAAAFFAAGTGRPLSEEQVRLLAERTEGWAAGLQLAALSLVGQPDVERLVAGFRGDHRFVMDYLVDEVLRQQPEPTQAFLRQTAVLERLSGPLCDAVVEGSGSQELLAELERRNLFLIPLDQQRQWYRYHHLFAEVLRARLAQIDPAGAARLHRRAGSWYEAQGLTEPAVDHLLAAGEHERAADLIAAAAEAIWYRGDNGILLRWLAALPEAAVRARPGVAFTLAWGCMTSGQVEQAETLLLMAEAGLAARAPADDEDRALLGRVLAIRAHAARNQGNLPGAVEFSHRALALVPAADDSWRGMVLWNLGAVHYWTGELEAADRVYAEARQRLARVGQLYGLLRVTVWHGEILADAGRLPEALAACEEVLALARAQGGDERTMLSMGYLGLGELHYERWDLERAHEYLTRAAERSRAGGLLDVTWMAHTPLARVYQARGEHASALACLDSAEQVAPRAPWALAHGVINRARLLLAQGRWEEASALAPQLEALVRSEAAPLQRAARALALLKVEQGFPEEALAVLAPLAAGAAGQVPSIRLLALQAVVESAAGRQTRALQTLGHALELAAPGGNVAPFMELGERMTRLLAQGQSRWQGKAAAHALRLLALLSPAAGAGQTAPVAGLLERPSERELEVLALLAAGATNEEIARSLYVSVHTSKKHVANLLGKLGVNNRTQAVARARELGLL